MNTNSALESAFLEFCAADDAFNAALRSAFGCETGPDRHDSDRWSPEIRNAWRKRCRARREYHALAYPPSGQIAPDADERPLPFRANVGPFPGRLLPGW